MPEVERNTLRVTELLASLLATAGVDQFRGHCTSKRQLLAYLEQVFLPRAIAGEKFMLHFVSHGGADGLWVKETKECVYWGELRPYLESINSAMKGELLLNVTSCIGGKSIQIVDVLSEHLPFFGTIGPRRTIDAIDAITLNSAFYRSLLQHADVPLAVEEANKAVGEELIFAVSAEGYRSLAHTNDQREVKEILRPPL